MPQAAILRRFFVLCAALACLVLGLVALFGAPTNTADLLAGGVIAAGAGLVALLL